MMINLLDTCPGNTRNTGGGWIYRHALPRGAINGEEGKGGPVLFIYSRVGSGHATPPARIRRSATGLISAAPGERAELLALPAKQEEGWRMLTLTVCVHGEKYDLELGAATVDRLFRLAIRRGVSPATLAREILEARKE